jgi:hypothetical protein
MLEQLLAPLVQQLDPAESAQQANYTRAEAWFRSHEEPLVQRAEELRYLCTLPRSIRTTVTYPVIGNWFLDKIDRFEAHTAHQRQVRGLLRTLVCEKRFNNHHAGEFYANRDAFNRDLDALYVRMLANVAESTVFHELLQTTNDDLCETIGKLAVRRIGASVDLGHGVLSPANSFAFLTFHYDVAIKRNRPIALPCSIMVVDDECAGEWYTRMIGAGFKEVTTQQGSFSDCESALVALPDGHYDVVLTDLDLGVGKMTGEEFIERAYGTQRKQGIAPLLSAFSYDNNRLFAAEQTFGRGHDAGDKLFHQVTRNDKRGFTALDFRNEVDYTLQRRQRQQSC